MLVPRTLKCKPLLVYCTKVLGGGWVLALLFAQHLSHTTACDKTVHCHAIAQERTATAEALKQEGNSLYAEGKHAEAQVTCQISHHAASGLLPAQPAVNLLYP